MEINVVWDLMDRVGVPKMQYQLTRLSTNNVAECLSYTHMKGTPLPFLLSFYENPLAEVLFPSSFQVLILSRPYGPTTFAKRKTSASL